MLIVFFSALGYALGAMPFSLWLARLTTRTDIRRIGDGNTGAANAWKVGGCRTGVPAMLLDFFKGAIPVGLAQFGFGITGSALIPIALAPVIGHAFSIFLGGRG